MKKVIVLIISLLICLLSTFSVFAEGEVVGDGSGSDLSGASGENKSLNGDGVRITVYNVLTGSKVGNTVDFTNKNWGTSIQCYTVGYSKVDYLKGKSLNLLMGNKYSFKIPKNQLPNIIQDINGNINIAVTKEYFKCDDVVREVITKTKCNLTVHDFETGRYTILLEPVGYFKFGGITFALTATEVAMVDKASGGKIRSVLADYSHKNLPLSMYLDRTTVAGTNLHLNVWTGSTTARANDDDIINNLGNALVIFKDKPGYQGQITTKDYTYLCDSDVITSFYISSDSDLWYEDDSYVSLNINGDKYKVGPLIIPAGEQQLVWVKWHTPSYPCNFSIPVTVESSILEAPTKSINIKVVKYPDEVTPPDPKGTDTNSSFNNPSASRIYKAQSKSTSWSVWTQSDHSYRQINMSVNINSNLTIKPNSKVPTSKRSYNTYTMRSGYGFNADISNSVNYTNTNEGAVGLTPYANITFPEFNYATYNRVFERSGNYLQLKSNSWSQFSHRVHFTPVWFPDGWYSVKSNVQSIWTPNGEITFDLSDNIKINGSVFDDYYVMPKK